MNHGPAVASDVTIDVDPASDVHWYDGEPPFTVPLLHAGQEHHYLLTRVMGDHPPAFVVLRWSDGRRKRQERTVYLSVRQIV